MPNLSFTDAQKAIVEKLSSLTDGYNLSSSWEFYENKKNDSNEEKEQDKKLGYFSLYFGKKGNRVAHLEVAMAPISAKVVHISPRNDYFVKVPFTTELLEKLNNEKIFGQMQADVSIKIPQADLENSVYYAIDQYQTLTVNQAEILGESRRADNGGRRARCVTPDLPAPKPF